MVSDSLSLVSKAANGSLPVTGKAASCLICHMDVRDRRAVEELMARGVSNNTIITFAKNLKNPVDLTSRIITRHIDHLPARLFVFKEILERRMADTSLDAASDSTTRLTPVAYLEMLMADAAEGLVRNPASTAPLVGLQAAKELREIERERADDGEAAEWVLRYKQLIEAVRSVCDDAQIRDILAIVDRG